MVADQLAELVEPFHFLKHICKAHFQNAQLYFKIEARLQMELPLNLQGFQLPQLPEEVRELQFRERGEIYRGRLEEGTVDDGHVFVPQTV